jgi:short-subunit dehydrogenase
MSKSLTLITGASSGIGRELAIIFAAQHHDLLLVARNERELKNLADELQSKYSVTVECLALDLSRAAAPLEVYDFCLARHWEIDHLINNAGFGDFGLFAESDVTKQLNMINLNISALVYLTHLFLPEMIRRGSGRIMNVASTAAFQPGPLMSVYYATKAFVLHFSEALANEVRSQHITVTALCPGPTASNFAQAASMTESKLMKDKKLPTARAVAEYGYERLMAGQAVAIYGWKNYLLANAVRFIPRSLAVKMVRKIQNKF